MLALLSESGLVEREINLTDISKQMQRSNDDVLNGIAWDAKGKRLFVTGKKSKLILAQPNPRDLNALRELIEDGLVKSIIGRTYKLEEIAEAHAYSEMGHAVGKIAITAEETSLVD